MFTSSVKSPAPNAICLTRVPPENQFEAAETARRLDDRDQIDRLRHQALLALQLRQEPINRGKRGGAFDLWQDDPVEAGADDRD
jgi:hypothetical protein